MTHDMQGRAYVKYDQVKEGQTVFLDGGFPCRKPGPATIHMQEERPYFECSHGQHFLDDQVYDDDDDDVVVGVYVEDPGPLVWQWADAA